MKEINGYGTQKEFLENEEVFKALVKIYTGCAYKAIGSCMRKRQYGLLSHYATNIVTSLSYQNSRIFYNYFNSPVYRGGKVNLKNIKEGDIKSWPTFTSTSASKEKAIEFKDQAPSGKGVLTKIFINGQNSPQTYIDCRTNQLDWSFYPSEEEILLLPFFTFQVMKIEEI